MRTAFYVSNRATRLKEIIETSPHEIIESIQFAFSDDHSNSHLSDLLESKGIKYILMDWKKIGGADRHLALSNALLAALKEHEVDFCFSFGSHILKGSLLAEYENRLINFHPSLLPSFPGINALDQAMAANANVVGNTAHFIDAGVDTGPVIMQSAVHSRILETAGYAGVLSAQAEMFRKIFYLLRSGRIKVRGHRVTIDGADYSQTSFFPLVDMANVDD